MAKNRKQRQRQKERALKKARSDGRVTNSEAKKLRSLGVPAKKITNTKKGTVKVSKIATKQASKPKPKSSSSPTAPARAAAAKVRANTPATTSPSSRPTNIFKQKETGGDKFLTGKQANQVLKLVSDPQRFGPTTVTDPEGNVTTTPGGIDFESIAGERLIGKALRGLSKQGININDISSQNDLNKIKNYVRGIATQNNNGLPGGDRSTGDYDDIVAAYKQDAQVFEDRGSRYRDLLRNTEAYSPEFVAMAQELGRIPSLQEVKAASRGIGGTGDRAYNKFVRNLRGATKGAGLKRNGIGKGVKNARTKDINAEYALIAAELGLDPAAGPGGPTAVGRVKTAGGTETATVVPTAGTGITTTDETNPYAGIIAGLEGQIADLQLQTNDLGSLADGFAQSNQFMSDQAAASAQAYAAAEKRASNLANAFVPNANPNANSINYGDYRKRNRRKEDNQLSDLAILSDLGDSSNPLAGLQLA